MSVLTQRSERFQALFRPKLAVETPPEKTEGATPDKPAPEVKPEEKAAVPENGKTNGTHLEDTPAKPDEGKNGDRLTGSLSDIIAITKERLAAKKAEADKKPAEIEKIEAVAKPEEVKAEGKAPEVKPAAEAPAPETEKVQVRKRRPDPLPAPSVDKPEVKAEPAPELLPKSLEERAGFRLDEDQRDYLEHVEYAEKIDPAKKGLLDRELTRLKKFEDSIRTWEKDHPGEEFRVDFDDETKHRFAKLQRENPPALGRKDLRTVEQRRIRDEVKQELEQDFAKRTEPIERGLTEVRRGPKIAAQVADIEKSLLADLPDDFKEAKTKGIAALVEDDPVLGNQVAGLITNAGIAVNEYLQMASHLKPMDLERNPHHQWIAKTVVDAGEWFKVHGKESRVQDGKEFVTAGKWVELSKINPQETQAKYWTFNEDQVVGILRDEAARLIKDGIEKGKAELQKGGYVRQPKGEAAKPAPEKTEEKAKQTSPRVATSPSGGGSANASRKADLWDRHLMTASRPKSGT